MALAGSLDKVKQGMGELIDHQAVIEFLNFNLQEYQSRRRTGTATSLAGKASSAVNPAFTSVAAKASSALKGVKGALGTDTAAKQGLNQGRITVQYNPKSIQFSASTKENTGSQQEGNYRVTTVTATCTITMSVELIFSAKFPTDTSVKEQVDMFLYLMQKNTGRRIRFSWANVMFEGEAMSLSAAYDMFDAAGNPISAKVSLGIQGTSGANVLSKAYEQLEQERPQEAEPTGPGDVAGAAPATGAAGAAAGAAGNVAAAVT